MAVLDSPGRGVARRETGPGPVADVRPIRSGRPARGPWRQRARPICYPPRSVRPESWRANNIGVVGPTRARWLPSRSERCGNYSGREVRRFRSNPVAPTVSGRRAFAWNLSGFSRATRFNPWSRRN